MSNLIKKLILRFKIVSLYGLSQSIAPIGQLLISFIIIKYKSIELWGGYVEILIWINLLLLFLSFGSNDYLLKIFSKNPSKSYQLWFTNSISRIILLIPCIIIIFNSPVFDEISWLSSVWLLFIFIGQSYKVLILYHKDFKFSLITEILYNALFLLLIILKIDLIDLKTILTMVVLANIFKSIIYIYYYFKKMNDLKWAFDFTSLRSSIPFFIPVALGTVRVKIDTYFANSFFNPTDLGKYQILISFLSIGHITTTYFVNPFLKVFFRLNGKIIKKIRTQFFIFGLFYGLLFIFLIYLMISKVYLIQFSFENYMVAYAFLVPLFFQMLIVNQIYKYDQQFIVSYTALFVIVLQISIGYLLVKYQGIQGALLLKAGSQWLITILLWFWFRKIRMNNYM